MTNPSWFSILAWLIYVSRKVIAPVYLLDAAAEVLLIAAWLAVAATV